MLNAGFQYLEQRDANDTITKNGVVSKNSPFATSDNSGIYDVIAENFRAIKDMLDTVSSSNDLSSIRDEVKTMYDDMRTNEKFGSIEATEQAAIAKEQAAIATEKAKEAAASLTSITNSSKDISADIKTINDSISAVKTYLDTIQSVQKDVADNAQVAANQKTAAKQAADKAGTSETNAASSAVSSAASASAAKDSETNAKTSESNAKASETNASTYAATALSYKNDAAASATSASSYATAANEAAVKSQTASANSQIAEKWAVSTDSPDGGNDSSSPTEKTQSSRTWALYAKEQAQSAALVALNVQSIINDAVEVLRNSLNTENRAYVDTGGTEYQVVEIAAEDGTTYATNTVVVSATEPGTSTADVWIDIS